MNDSFILKKINNFDNIQKINKKIFHFVENGNWEDVKMLIKKNDKNFDYNIKNEKNIYLIEYLILFNQIDIVKSIIKNIKLDITDENNKSILYNTIKFFYNDLLEVILKENEIHIGKNIIEIYDLQGNNSLMFCIKFNNTEALKILCNYVNNFNSKNEDGYNSFHYSIINDNFEAFKILSKFYNLNILTNDGETPLHLSIKNNSYDMILFLLEKKVMLNITEDKYNFTPLFYISISNDYEICVLIENYIHLFDGNIQDKSGNIFYNYFINKITLENNKMEIMKMFEIYKKVKFSYNLHNIDGNIPLHLILEKISIYKNYEKIIKDAIIHSDLNIQNSNGESCLYLLLKYDYWENIIDLLIKKKLDIFILNNERKNMLEFLNKDKLKKFLKLVTDSYLYNLKLTKQKLYLKDDNECKELIHLNKKNNCFDIVFNRIKAFVDFFLKKNIIQNKMFSYPKKNIYPKLIENYENISISSYSTTSINIFFGLLYLSKKYKNTKSPIDFINKNTKLISCKNNICEFINYSFHWINFKFINHFENFESYIHSIKNKIEFFIIPLGIEIYDTKDYKGHANYIIFDFKNKIVERFEPYGSEPPLTMNYDSNLLDNVLENFILSLNLNFHYITPNHYLPKISFQLREIYELKNNYIGDPDGFCSAWCIFWTEMRLKHSYISIYKLEKILSIEIVNNNLKYKNLIRNYSKNITDVRDIFLEKINSNINDWNNDKINNEKIIKLENLIKKKI